MYARGFLTENLTLDLSILSWLIAQVLKIAIHYGRYRKFDFRLLVSSGGMPSSHSAFVCAGACAIGVLSGFTSTVFALAVIVALVVMYDACNVRRAAGEQAKILNHIMEHWQELSPDMMGRELKELLGHTPLQVFMGALLGVAVGLGGAQLLG